MALAVHSIRDMRRLHLLFVSVQSILVKLQLFHVLVCSMFAEFRSVTCEKKNPDIEAVDLLFR